MKGLARSSRWKLWGALFAGAAWLAVFGDKAPQDTAAIAKPAGKRRPAVRAEGAASAPVQELLGLVPRMELVRQTPATAVDLFSAHSWTPPPLPEVAAPAPPPTAPPLPYVYAGKKLEGDQWEVYLARGEAAFIVRQGGSLEGTYVVERIDPPTMTLIYRPLGHKQDLNIGE